MLEFLGKYGLFAYSVSRDMAQESNFPTYQVSRPKPAFVYTREQEKVGTRLRGISSM